MNDKCDGFGYKRLIWILMVFGLFVGLLEGVMAQEKVLTVPTLVSGPVQGHTTDTTTKIWLLTRYIDELNISLYNDKGETMPIKKYDKQCTFDAYCNFILTFSGLTANTTYRYEIVLSDKETVSGTIKSLQSTEMGAFSFLIASCAYIPDKKRQHLTPGINKKSYRTAAKTDADFMVWMGDNHYFRDGEWRNNEAMFKRYIHTRTYKPMMTALQSKPQYSVWDDHDYGANNGGTNFANKDYALSLFKQFWANPSYGSNDTKGVFCHFSYQDADFFLLDGRFHKEAYTDSTGTILGKEQMKWLRETLKKSTATFKFIVCGVQFINTKQFRDFETEGFGQYTNTQEELFTMLEEENIKGVIFLSGDRHFSQLYCYKRPQSYDLYEITSSSISSFSLAFPPFPITEKNSPNVVPKTLYWPSNFGEVCIDGEKDNRKCVVKIKNKRGGVVWTKTLHQSDLE